MIVFAFFEDSRLNQALAALRKSGAGPLPYKAILTPTNQNWTPAECFDDVYKRQVLDTSFSSRLNTSVSTAFTVFWIASADTGRL